MAKFHVSRSIDINAPIEKVFSTLNDYNHWTPWSPWLIMDPKAEVKVAEDAKSYEWEGPRTGSGKMVITGEKENQSLDIDLTFLKPWKSQAKVYFETKEKDGGTQVTWKMDGSLPFFMFWMKTLMSNMIGMDYARGLRLLKDYIEDGEVHSKLNWKGNEEFKGGKFVGIKTSCTMETMGKKMAEDLPKLHKLMEEQGLKSAGVPFTQYHKWNFKTGDVEYTAGIPVESIPENLPSGFHGGELPAMKVYTLEHQGPHAHLGNAWSTLYTMQRGKEIPVNKKIHPFETYLNNPNEVDQNELITQIHFPLN